ncbi:hypothetical protein RN001_005273 [Aquatica leii]|uniref:Uncharacterized protein n=1 Tax=Aquatica leii TaxID=1421715 RepID=A0AAN7SIR2_9COLE|nr:hypothetical protein RN001_005273 [Aquatica leii]
MPEVFGIEFATTCSYKGQNDNFKVDGTAVLSTIKELVQSNFEDLRNEVFKSAVSDWFRGARLRLKRHLKKNVT